MAANSPPSSPVAAPTSWAMPQPEPTTLIVFHPGEAPAAKQDVVAALLGHFSDQSRQVAEPTIDEPGVQWAVVLETPDLPGRLFIWCESAHPVAPDEYGNPEAEACTWIVGIETVLDPRDPPASFARLLRAAACACPRAPAILDVATTFCHPRAWLDEHLMDSDIDPPAEMLWLLQAVAPPVNDEQDDARPDDDPLWLHSHGLSRCGRPELEMLEVPRKHGTAAVALLSEIASLLLEHPVPTPGQTLDIGVDLRVTLQPWQSIVPHLADETPGSIADRALDDDDSNAPAGAVVCAPEPRGQFRKVWVWPRDVIEAVEAGNALLFRTQRATQRQAALARRAWPKLIQCMAILSALGDEVTCRVQAAFSESDKPDAPREHLWFEVDGIEGHTAHGRLEKPPRVLKTMHLDRPTDITAERVSDWELTCASGRFGPETISTLSDALATLMPNRDEP